MLQYFDRVNIEEAYENDESLNMYDKMKVS